MRKLSWGRLRRPKSRRATVTVVSAMASALLAVVAVFAVTAQAGVNNAFTRVQRAAPAPVGGHMLAAPSATAAQSGYVVLKPRNEAALKNFIAGVTNHKSASFHHYLKAGQFASRFGPTEATIAAVKTQLVKDGLKVGTVSKDGLMIPFHGTTNQVQRTFNTTLRRFRTEAGRVGQLATKTVKLPASIAPDVTAVLGLNTVIHPESDLVRAPRSAYKGRRKATKGHVTRNASVIAPDPGAHTSANAACKAPDGGNAVEEDANNYGGLTDDQIANAYGAFGLYNANDDGAGVHVALYELEPFSLSDLKTFDQCYFGTSQAKTMIGNVAVHSVDGGQPTGPGSGESILDIEDVSAMAPGANIDVYEAPNTTAGGIDNYAQIISADQDQIISSSWGECEQDEATYDPGAQEAENYIFQQAAAQGQTVLSAAGDTGDDTCNEIRQVPPPTDQNPLSVMDPGSNPYVMAVGGTTLDDANPNNLTETVWNDGANWGGGGGGISQTWTMPSWQADAQVPGISDAMPGGTDWNNANTVEANAAKLGISNAAWPTGFCQNTAAGANTNTPCRALPDVSAQADEFTGGVTIYSTEFQNTSAPSSGWITIGGTSSATPIWAAMLALTDESSACSAVAPSNGGNGIGLATPLLYAVASNPTEYAASFHDITVGNNDVYGFQSGTVFPARTGYDMASGLGSPMLTSPSGGAGLAANLCGMVTAATPAVTVTGLSPTSGPVAGGNTVTVSGTGFESGGASDVSSVQVGGATVPAADITVSSNTSLTINSMPTGAAAGAPMNGGGATGTQDGAGQANVVVTTTAGASSPMNSTSAYQYVDTNGGGQTVPMVSSVSPYAEADAGGTVTIHGAGFDNSDTVTIGGVAATNVTYVNPNELTATAPQYASGNTDCVTSAALTAETAALGVNGGAGDTNPAADDICQTQVVVTNGNGSSQTATINPTYEGPALPTDQDGIPLVPQGYEIAPQTTEFDYIPTPTITSVSTDPSSWSSLASEAGGTVITIKGTGLNDQTLNWFDVGDPTQASSEAYTYAYYSGTEVQLVAPAQAPTVDASNVSIYPDTMANAANVGATTPGTVVYGGVPDVTAVSTGTVSKAYGLPVAPAFTSGTPLTVTGDGFSDASNMLLFTDVDSPFSESTSYQNTASSDTTITGTTPNSNPAIDDVLVCTVTTCSTPTSTLKKGQKADEMLFYPPGNPKINKLSILAGPASGGQTVTISGENLGCATSVMFGGNAARIEPSSALLDCGSTSSVTVVAPPGKLGSAVTVKLTTVESDATGAAAAVSQQHFRYTADPRLSTSSLQFGSARLKRTGTTRSLSVINPAGTAPVTVGKISITGAAKGSFSLVKNGCKNATLGAGQSCKVMVLFLPNALGKRTASLQVPYDQASAPLTASLMGTGKS